MKFKKSLSLPTTTSATTAISPQISSISLNMPTPPIINSISFPKELLSAKSSSSSWISSFKIDTTDSKIFDLASSTTATRRSPALSKSTSPSMKTEISKFPYQFSTSNNNGGGGGGGDHLVGSYGQIDSAFYPYRIILWIFGRFPFSPETNNNNSSSRVLSGLSFTKKGNNSGAGASIKNSSTSNISTKVLATNTPYSYNVYTFHWCYFILTSIFIAFVLVMCSLGFVNIFLNWNLGDHSAEERDKVKENLVAFVLFWSCLFHSTVSNISFWTNRKRIVDYLNHWNVVMDIVGLHVPGDIKRFLILSNIWYAGFLTIVLAAYAINFTKIARGASVMVATLTLRQFIPEVYKNGSYGLTYLFGLLTLVYGIYASRSILFIYLFKSRLLRHAFRTWNTRLKDQLYKNSCDDLSKLYNEKILCEKLYSDHYILVNLVKQTDRVFGSILQSYYASQILNMCFELYYLARFGPSELTKGSGTEELIAAVLLLFQTVLLFFTISLDAAYVNEDAMKGFELLRSRGLRTDDSTPKKYLIYSLEMSYSQRIVLTGGKFFAVDRPFIITVLGAVFTYFIIILQFGIGADPDSVSTNTTTTGCVCGAG